MLIRACVCLIGGPLPEDLLESVEVPVLVGWGAKDPWEPISMGRLYENYKCVEEFVTLENVGHCPQVSFSLMHGLTGI